MKVCVPVATVHQDAKRGPVVSKQLRKRTRSIGPWFWHLTFWKYESDRSKRPHWAPGDRRFLVFGLGRGVVGYFMLRPWR